MAKEQSDYAKARKRVKAKKEFYQNFTTYLVMSVFFVILNTLTSPEHWWAQWPILGWGLGVVFHYFDTFGYPGAKNSAAWEERAIEAELERMKSTEAPTQTPLPEALELKELEKQQSESKKWDDSELV